MLLAYTSDLISFCQRQKGNMSAHKNASLQEEFIIWEMRVLQSLESLRNDLDVQQQKCDEMQNVNQDVKKELEKQKK